MWGNIKWRNGNKKKHFQELNEIENPDILYGKNTQIELPKNICQKDYYNSLVSGKSLYKKLLNHEKEFKLAEYFNFNLKFIAKYRYKKNKTQKKKNENEEDFIERVINEFYKEEGEKMSKKIDVFFRDLAHKNNITLFWLVLY